MPLIIKNLSYYPEENIKIIDKISYTFMEGLTYSIIGKSGSGKTTFLKTLNNLLHYEGIITYKNKNILDYSPPLLRRTILYVPQEPILFGSTVNEDLAILSKFKIYRNRPLKLAQLDNYLDLFNLNKEVLNKNTNELSGGEKQRIGLIKALLINPDVFLFDEPTAALDMHTENLFIKSIKTITDEKIIISVSHSKEVINNANIKLFFLKGKIIGEKNNIIDDIYLKNFLENG
jgi:putative ABC transport system ATP-binding protein